MGLGGSGALSAHGARNREERSRNPQLPTKYPSRRTRETGVGRCPLASKRGQALVSMALPQSPEGDSLPTGVPKPSEDTAGPSQAPASPAVTRRQLLLRELEAQVQAAYGQVRGQGCGISPK